MKELIWTITINFNELFKDIKFWGWLIGVSVMGASCVFMVISINGYMELRKSLVMISQVVPQHEHDVRQHTHNFDHRHTDIVKKIDEYHSIILKQKRKRRR